jgi:hypothetical protein
MERRQISVLRGRVSWVLAGWLLLLVAQFGLLYYPPLAQLPTRRDRETAERFIQRLRDLPGEVWLFNRGYLSSLAGKSSYFNGSLFSDVVGGTAMPPGSDQARRREMVWEVFRQALKEQRFNWVIIDNPQTSWAPYYLPIEDLFIEDDPFYPVTGARSRPENLMVKNPVVHGGALPLHDPVYAPLFDEGWGASQPWGRPVIRRRAQVDLALEEKGVYRLSATIQPRCNEKAPIVQAVEVRWNDQPLGREKFALCKALTISLDLPPEFIRKEGNRLSFQFEVGPVLQADPLVSKDSPLADISSIEFLALRKDGQE